MSVHDPIAIAVTVMEDLQSTKTERGLVVPVWRPESPPVPPDIMNRKRPTEPLLEAEALTVSRHRVAVTACETRNAGRLAGLLWVISELRRVASQDQTAADAERQLVEFVHREYPGLSQHLRGARLPDDRAELRMLCTRATRDYIALPKGWR